MKTTDHDDARFDSVKNEVNHFQRVASDNDDDENVDQVRKVIDESAPYSGDGCKDIEKKGGA